MDGRFDLVDTMIELDVELVKSWYLLLTNAGIPAEEAIVTVAKAIRDMMVADRPIIYPGENFPASHYATN